MKPFDFVVLIGTVILCACLASQASAQCSRGSCGAAVVQQWSPDQGTVHQGVLAERPVLGAPVRIVGRVAGRIVEAQPLRRVGRLVLAPFRVFRGGCR
jgi:hypothetical protein